MRYIKLYMLLFALLLLDPLTGSGAWHPIEGMANPSPDSIANAISIRAGSHAEKLLSLQKKTTHLWKKSGWWNDANILESLIDYYRIKGKDFSSELNIIYTRNLYGVQTRYISPSSFDDNEWWALTWLKAYDMTGDKRYLAVSESIFNDMIKRSWDTECGGGMQWNYVKHYKNAVTNELFIALAARLALETKDSIQKEYYKGWALKEWNWFRKSNMYTDSLWISDGLNKDCTCNFSPDLNLTYNQGIILGALKYLYDLTGDKKYITESKGLAHASMKKYSNSKGILTEYGQANPDKIQFKGIYVRYLALLNTELHDESIKTFILHNADHAWASCRGADGLCDWDWNGPYTDWSGSAQGSMMDLMNAALLTQQ
jgi:predicted alpha-1,6-mannanase (GH76 family)